MYIKALSLVNFRNIERLQISFNQKSNIIIGDNAQGKTNILEAIYTAINGKSFRTKNDAELIKKNREFCRIKLDFFKNNREQCIEVVIAKNNKKRITINGVPIKKTFELIGYLNVVLFAPEDLRLIKGSPSERRKYIDREISHISKQYLNALIHYHRILNQKNKHLKMLNEPDDTLDIWDRQLANYGSQIVLKRLDFVAKLNDTVAPIHAKISEESEYLTIAYDFDSSIGKDKIETYLYEQFVHNRAKDIRYGYTTFGPHRDDLIIMLNDKQIKKYGSQGQQRTALLAMKLAEIEIIESAIEEIPILMLDDVMSELDTKRQTLLLKEIKKTQTLLTTTDLHGLSNKNIAPYRQHYIVDGSIESSQEVLDA